MAKARVLTPCDTTSCVDNQLVIGLGFKSAFYATQTAAADGLSNEIMLDLGDLYQPRSLFLINSAESTIQ